MCLRTTWEESRFTGQFNSTKIPCNISWFLFFIRNEMIKYRKPLLCFFFFTLSSLPSFVKQELCYAYGWFFCQLGATQKWNWLPPLPPSPLLFQIVVFRCFFQAGSVLVQFRSHGRAIESPQEHPSWAETAMLSPSLRLRRGLQQRNSSRRLSTVGFLFYSGLGVCVPSTVAFYGSHPLMVWER